MGNTESNVTSGVKKQAGPALQPIYKLVGLKGGGLLVEMMKKATQNKQYTELDHAIKTKVEPFLYNKGVGRYFTIADLVLLRNKERPRHKLLTPLKSMEDPEDYQIDESKPEITEAEYKQNPHLYRLVCWKIGDRGAVGETILHLCLLNATALHADLAKRLLSFYPKMINDIYMSDEYYGENVLHIAIVNEDPSMVRYLLDSGVDLMQRFCGNFMCPEDQKSTRYDSQEHEWVCVAPQTNYDGYVYWGEYPLSVAACLGQEESFRLILSRGADPNAQDTNGNTVLHLLVIHQKLDTFDSAYEVGADLSIRNLLQLTPLTLAAQIARRDIFFRIMSLEREIYWQIGSITCCAYPLYQIDTIDMVTGTICKVSALNLVVFGDKDEHLELMDGVLIDLLNAKWNTFVKFKFYKQFFTFTFYFIVSVVAFTLRPGPITDPEYSTSSNTTAIYCRLLELTSLQDQIRLSTEFVIISGALSYLFAAGREANFLGWRMFFENLMTAPSRVMFLISCILMLNVPVLRGMCLKETEDVVVIAIMLTTAPYFLFFCRGFKTVGPFVVMIYRMVMGDLIRFASIYLVFVMGFSQAFYIIFLSFNAEDQTNPISSPIEAIMAMFLMSLTNFSDYYTAFEYTDHEYAAKIMFVIFMVIVSVLLINMLIAMMGNTYQKIAETRNEWQRQWARIVLVVERGVSPAERLRKLFDYSQPMSDGKRALVLRLNQSDDDKEEMKEILEIKRRHDRNTKKYLLTV